MRTMLGVPRWSNVCAMQRATRLLPLATRVQYIMACRVTRMLQRDVEGVVLRRLQLIMTQSVECLRNNTWLINTSLSLHDLIHAGNWPWREADVLTPTLNAPPPWESPAAEFTAIQLPASNALCTTQELRQHALMVMDQVTEPDIDVYFTDGSVDPESGRIGAAVITGARDGAVAEDVRPLLYPPDRVGGHPACL